ncbi:MAG: extracellular solute-binding protein [Alphaproteobacteria bacterium]
MRRFLSAFILFALFTSAPALAAELPWRHGLSLMGEPKYKTDFKHFDYVNPQAPKGGVVRMAATGAFDNFNLAVAGVKGQLGAGIGLLYNTLLTSSLDEVSTAYGDLAEAVAYPNDISFVTYRLRANAKWHDGTPITPDDVIFSFDALKANSPQYAAYYANVTKAEKTGEHEVTFRFDQPGNRELPQIVGQFPIFPKHWWSGKDASGKQRSITETTLEQPLGSGAYRIKSFAPGRSITYERVKDYWGKDLPTAIGTNNFDEMRYEYFRDSTVQLEGLKGDQYDFRLENSAKNWATAYDFTAVKDGRVVREEFAERASGRMQGFAMNLRREKFNDQRVRRALNLAFDFEEMNKTVFFGAYKRIGSYFEGTELASSALPQGLEKDILENVKNKIPSSVFTKAYTNPVNGTPQAVRDNLKEADRLLKDAGYPVKDGKRVDAKGEPFVIELLADDPSFERILLFWKPSLEKLGLTVTVRVVDPAQYENRMRDFDFDITTDVWGQSLSPGNEQREFWGTEASTQKGSRNTMGIADKGIDALIDRIAFAKSRNELVAATRALDRVLLAYDFIVPQWTYGFSRTARWNRFSHPDKMPEYGASAFPTVWWYDDMKAKDTAAKN